MKRDDGRQKIRFRITIIGLCFALAYVLLLSRSFYLQVLERDHLAAVAQKEFMRQVEIDSRRGLIFDRNQEELAVTLDSDSIYARPVEISDPAQVGLRLASVLGDGDEKIISRLSGEKRFAWLARRVTPDKARAVRQMEIKGIGITTEPKRFYPHSTLACHVLGFTGLDAKGLEGLEAQYDSELTGTARTSLNMRDALGRTMHLNPEDFSGLPQGNHLLLTIDKQLQYQVEKILAATVSKYNAAGGQAIVMVPQSGEILAMAIEPSFNPNAFSSYPASVYRNRAVTDAFEPGSTFKMFVAAAALNQGKISLQQKIFCENGQWQVAGKVIHDTHNYGYLTVGEIIKYSSNIGTAKLGQMVGPEELNRAFTAFGFGQPTGVDMPGEAKGILRPVTHNRPVDLANICFGQGVAVTGLQLISAVSAVANGGVLMRPFLVKAIMDSQASLVSETRPAPLRRVVSIEAARELTEMLRQVTEEGGTGSRIKVDNYAIAGKTGTAQKAVAGGYSKQDYISSFVGFLPADNPQLTVLVVIDSPRGGYYGGQVAGPAWAAIAGAAMERLDWNRPQLARSPQDKARAGAVTLLAAPLDPSPSLAQGLMPDLRGFGLREVLALAGSEGFDLKAKGVGKVIGQQPAAGSVLQRGGSWSVSLSAERRGI
ncbi:MAG: serine hydrolase [Desulfarculales bacterium]|jgi:cell division protein FtsI (penicillin-binding protein 3)|nr:serine hydrolase [Desulfarculales bacterium]